MLDREKIVATIESRYARRIFETRILCKSKEERYELLYLLDELGYKWRSGDTLLRDKPFNVYGNQGELTLIDRLDHTILRSFQFEKQDFNLDQFYIETIKIDDVFDLL